MFGKKNRLSLQSQKQILVAESDLNRALMLQECGKLAGGLRGLSDRAKALSTIGSSIIPFVVGLAKFARRKPEPAASKSSWFKRAVAALRLGLAVWRVIRSRRPAREESNRPPTAPEPVKATGQ